MTILEYLLAYKYLAIFVGVMIEGPTVMAATGFLVSLGYFNPVAAFCVLLVGDVVSDVGWYCVGYFKWHGFLVRFGNFIGFKQNIADRISALYHKHHAKILFISKLSMGFGFNLVVLITAGILRIPLKKFVAINFAGGIFWTAFVLTLGYFFGNIYLLIDKGLRTGFIIGVVIIFSLVLFGVSRFIRAEFLKHKEL